MKTNGTQPIMKRFPLLLLVLIFLAWGMGCDNQSGGTANRGAQPKLRLAFVANTPDDFWSVVRLGCDVATRQLGDVDLNFCFPASPTAEAQQELLNSLVASGVDGIAVSPVDAENQTDLLNSIAAKTLLVCVDSDANKSKRACYIGADNFAAGRQAADLLKAALPQGGKIVLFVSYLNAQNTKDRVQGIQAGLAGSNIQILDTLADGAMSSIAQKNAQDVLAKYPDLAGLGCLNGYQGPAILTAVREAGKAGKVKIVCFDDAGDTLAGIASGDIYGTIIQSPNNFGYQTILRMGRYLQGDKTQLDEGAILLPTKELTQDKVAQFQAWRKTLLLNAAAETGQK
jgi:ribose transport system substrate-binding protein